MKIQGELRDAILIRRLNRFVAEVEVEGELALAHVPNSGRMRELLFPGAEVLVAKRMVPKRTSFDLLMARCGSGLVSVDSRLPGRILEEALYRAQLPELGRFEKVRREVRLGVSRLDLLGEGPDGLCYIETKSVTLVREGTAFFPDAPTERGVRHLEELRRAVEAGHRAAAVFVIQREDARVFRPHAETDATFANTLRAVSSDVQILAYACQVERGEITIARRVPVLL